MSNLSSLQLKSELSYGTQIRAAQAANITDLTVNSPRLQLITPTASITVDLPSTGIVAGDQWTFRNLADPTTGFTITLQSGGQTVRTVYPSGGPGDVVSLVDAPSTAADWEGISQITSQWVTFVPSYTDSTGHVYASQQAIWRRIGSDILIKMNLLHTTGSNGVGTATWLIDNPVGINFVQGDSLIGGDCTMRRSNDSAGFFGDQSNGTVAIGGGANSARFYLYAQSNNPTGNEEGMTSLDVQDFGLASNQYDFIHIRLQFPLESWTETKG